MTDIIDLMNKMPPVREGGKLTWGDVLDFTGGTLIFGFVLFVVGYMIYKVVTT